MASSLPDGGRHNAEVVVDEEGYLEIREWGGLAADPTQAAATIARALAALGGEPGAPGESS